MVETKGLIQQGVWVVGGVLIAAIVMLGILAIVHDGQLAQTITVQLVTAINWGMPVLGGLLGINQLANAWVAVKQAAQPAAPVGAVPTTVPAPVAAAPAAAGSAL